MTAAEKLRAELKETAPFTKEEFIGTLVKKIRGRGYAAFICDRHISETKIDGNTITLKHEQIAISYAESEGFKVFYDYNSYGVRYIKFML